MAHLLIQAGTIPSKLDMPNKKVWETEKKFIQFETQFRNLLILKHGEKYIDWQFGFANDFGDRK